MVIIIVNNKKLGRPNLWLFLHASHKYIIKRATIFLFESDQSVIGKREFSEIKTLGETFFTP